MWVVWSVAALAGGPSTRERVAALEAEVARLTAENLAKVETLEALQADVAALREQLAALAEDDPLLAGLDARVSVVEAAVATPPAKGVDRRVGALQAEVAQLKADVQALRPAPPPAPPGDDEETAAADLLKEITAAVEVGDVTRAKRLLDDLKQRFPETRAGRASTRMAEELAIVGVRPGEPNVLAWFTEPAKLADHPLSLVVFWESWCPHCQREVPRLTQWVETFGARGLQVVALTRLTRGTTADDARAFVAEHGITFPVGQEDGKYAEAFGVKGIPAAALVRDGEVVWRGHPARLTETSIEGFLP